LVCNGVGHGVFMWLCGETVGLLGPGERLEVLALAEGGKKVIEQFGAKFVDGTWARVISTMVAVMDGRGPTCGLSVPHVL